ncbi:aldo/keto reductase [Sulfitobacter albidus]|uniref:Aldo/keto reductase n=1 Tax=Sulfitobacter albidus TaxID=2829501 RepID=A0A975JB84_9RHOB|nr:aldo/keto reductase [Sulfitobacter albidus]QUJ75248.1 aldo/keto reductase [Sulfitobacter albidus]
MKMNQLGRTGIEVSAYCLGTMTFGTQTEPAEAHAQIDRALAAGINFLDTAEMYPVNPVAKETIGRTEEIIGDWIARVGRRDHFVLATKHSGAGLAHVRDGSEITAQTIPEAIEGSLKRLKTDYIDLYQFHWPNRGSYMFRQNWTYDPSGQDPAAVKQNIDDCLGALQREVDAGRIRAFGMSNESAWGLTQWAEAAERGAGPRIASVQNEYSLMCRLADTDVAEACCNEDIGMLSFSPLAAGFLTGKYIGGDIPEGSRRSLNPEMGGRMTDRANPAAAAYIAVAERHGIDPIHMALAFVRDRPFMASTIFGATTLPQLDHILAGMDLTLGEEVMADLDAAHRAHPMPY